MAKAKNNNTNINTKRRMRSLLIIFIVLFLSLSIRIGYIQIAQGDELQEKAYKQQTRNRIISPKRGTIYDSTGKKLAISASAETVTVEPKNIKNEDKEKIAKAMNEILGVNYESTLNKLNKNTSIETIIKKTEKEKTDKLWAHLKENELTKGINVDEDTKRYYPYNDLASNLLGFCGDDNQGLEGVELAFDEILTGTSGKVVTAKDAIGGEIPLTSEMYIAPENGHDIVLTIDETIQSIAEKHLEQAVIENQCTEGGTVLIMNPKTGDILAMASEPNYNLNTPFTPSDSNILNAWEGLSSSERTATLQKMWRNRNITDSYEPGSVFKIVTAAIALEEGLAETDKTGAYSCIGHTTVSGVKINCWRYYRPHGSESLRDALKNSCNPVFIDLGQKIGLDRFYKYIEGFGLLEKTGVNLLGETKGIFFQKNRINAIELATISFGQRFQVTPLQIGNAVCAIANGGYLMKPRIVKEVINSDTGAVEIIEPVVYRSVVSEKTSVEMLSMLETVVAEGTGKSAQVTGFSIGGKTGTSEVGVDTGKFVASFVGIAPAENPSFIVLLALNDPKGPKGHQGGGIAAPVVGAMISEILNYLEIKPNIEYTDNGDNITVPDVRNKTMTQAIKDLEDAGFSVSVNTNKDRDTTMVKDQVPKPGISIPKRSVIKIYSEDSDVRISVKVPNLVDMTATQATSELKNLNLNIKINGTGRIISQEPSVDTDVEEGTIIRVELKETIVEYE